MPLENGVIAAIAKSAPDAKVRIFADSGKAYDLKFSLKGFAAAHDDAQRMGHDDEGALVIEPDRQAPFVRQPR